MPHISSRSTALAHGIRLPHRWGACAAALLMAAAGAAQAQTYVNVTVGGRFAPGVYGQLAIGNSPVPPLMNVSPIVVGTPIYGAVPVYMYVAPHEYRDWPQYCGRYNACGRPVYFVRVDESNRWWEPRHDQGLHRGWEQGRGHDERRRDRDHGPHGERGHGGRHD